ncbi:MAG: DNA topoisomerase IV subunit A [archaeon]
MSDDAKNKRKLEKEEESTERIGDFGKNISDTILAGKSPDFSMPIRSKNNVTYDAGHGYLELGDKMAKRYFLNVAHTRKFMQSMLVASACKTYIENDRTVGKRELYYNLKHSLPNSRENTFEDDIESGTVLDDLEASLDTLRENLHIEAKARGSIYGDITLSQAGDTFDCSRLGRGGWAIPGYTEDVEVVNHKADFILAIENDAMMSRLIQEKIYKKLNCILMTGEGMFPRGVRRFVKILSERLKLPVITFVDGDPYGFYIYSVLKYGSIQLAHLSRRYAIPDAKYVGMTMDDIDTYELGNVTERLKEIDKKRIREEMEYPWFKGNEVWMRQLKMMLEKGVRIEQQALANKSLDFVAKKYLPEKIEAEKFLF